MNLIDLKMNSIPDLVGGDFNNYVDNNHNEYNI